MVNIDALLNEWAYRCKKGYPDMDSPSDLRVLNKIMKEWDISFPKEQKPEINILEHISQGKKISLKDLL